MYICFLFLLLHIMLHLHQKGLVKGCNSKHTVDSAATNNIFVADKSVDYYFNLLISQ